MKLSIVIPCHNDTALLRRLLDQLTKLAVAEHIIIVDDGSKIPVRLRKRRRGTMITVLRNNKARGPGIARNMGLELVETDHVLFLDADDLPTVDLLHLLADLEGKAFDFCLFQHHDTRRNCEGAWGQPIYDKAFWQAAGCDLGALQKPGHTACSQLVQTSNYPWNKIYRTAFLRQHNIGCSDILLHEDIELHWRSFLHAKVVLCSDRVAVVHFVTADGERLTNNKGRERLDVFGVLPRLVDEIRSVKRNQYEDAFFDFLVGLMSWMRTIIPHESLSEFEYMERIFFQESFPKRAYEKNH